MTTGESWMMAEEKTIEWTRTRITTAELIGLLKEVDPELSCDIDIVTTHWDSGFVTGVSRSDHNEVEIRVIV